jgi:hypothetical protein
VSLGVGHCTHTSAHGGHAPAQISQKKEDHLKRPVVMAEDNKGGDRRQHARQRAVHAPVSEIYSRAHAGQMETGPVGDGSSEAEEQGGVACLRVELPKVDRSKFEKRKSKNFKVVDPRMETTGGSGIQVVGNGKEAEKASG